MAIQFARARYISRSTGGSAVRSAAYNGREAITAERTGELYYFRHRDAPEHHEVLLPAGVPERFRDIGHLWNAAEAAEKRKDAQVAREIVLALPADHEISTEDRIELARSFAEQHLVAKGLAVQLDVHAPHDPGGDVGPDAMESEGANWHAHLLITTRQVREQEQTALADAAALAKTRSAAVPTNIAGVVRTGRRLRPDQQSAFEHAIGRERLALIEGRAGTGKSYTLAAIHDAHALAGNHVIGLAPTNTVAQDLAASGFDEASTVHAALFRLKNGRDQWSARTVLVVDEAAMLDARITGELLAKARASGAKVILAGDDRQLASIERGGLFTEMRQRHGAAEISEVTRQRADWQRQAARDLAEGRFAEVWRHSTGQGRLPGPRIRTRLARPWWRPGCAIRRHSPAPSGSCSPTPTRTSIR